MKIPYYVIDAFTDKVFSGNPAGVCPLEKWLPDDLMQKIAAENNLSETAFFVKEGDGYRLRWFAPTAEVDLCGHATLAAGFVLYEFLGYMKPSVRFETRSGVLTVGREGGSPRPLAGEGARRAGEGAEQGGSAHYVLDFPAMPMKPCPAPAELVKGLGHTPREVFFGMDYVAVFDSAETVRKLTPDLEQLKKLPGRGVIVTAPGKDCDYVLRCFAPKLGIAEDPVTGSAQCLLAPYWAKRLGKTKFEVKQLSVRGGKLGVEIFGDRIKIAGTATAFLRGELSV